jgi:hypothetical protein
MAHLVNPISFRLNHVRYWNNAWCTSNNFNYSYLNIQDYYIYTYINFFFLTHKYLLGEILLENIKSIRVNRVLNIYIYIRDQSFCSFLFEECEWFYFYDLANTSSTFSKKLLRPEIYDNSSTSNKTNLVRKTYRFFFIQHFFRGDIMYKSFKNLGYSINIYKFKYFLESLTYFYKTYSNCIYYTSICKYKKPPAKVNLGFNYFRPYKAKTTRSSIFSKNLQLSTVYLISNKLFIIFLSFLLYKYIYFFFKILLKKNFKKLIKDMYFNVNFYFVLYWLSYFSAAFLGRYVRHKLLLNYPVGNILYKILALLTKAKKRNILIGFKILFSGRFSRKDRKLHK